MVDVRRRHFESIDFAEDGSIAAVQPRSLPYLFWFPEGQVSAETKARLDDRFGIVAA